MFWSPDINGGNPVIVADSTNTPWHSAEGPNDGFTPIFRGSIGKMRGYNHAFFCTYNVSRAETFPALTGNHYFDVYLAWSLDSGATWQGRQRLTNYFGPLKDCRFPNLAPESYWDFNYYNSITADIEYLSDSIPGFSISGAEESSARQHYLRVQVQITGVNNNQNNFPINYELLQNYQNPFNPVTIIKYLLPKPPFFKLTVYDALGKEIKVLVNENVWTADNKVSFDGKGLASGVYFYKLEISDGNKVLYSQSKKMVLLK
jgi:hypothetical protein